MRRTFTLLAAVLLVAAFTPAVLAANPDVYTGCLSPGGALNKIAIGDQPATRCGKAETQVTWDRTDPSFDDRIAALEARVAELEEPFGTLELSVDCAAGETLGAALAQAQDHPGPVEIAISGVCEENVLINRDDVFLHGQQRSDGLRAGSATGDAVSVAEARGVRFENMTIIGGRAGISAGGGSAFRADQVTVRETTVWAISVATGSTMDLNDCTIVDNAFFGVSASGGDINIQNSSVSGSGRWGVAAQDGGTVWVWNSTISGNDEGVLASYGGVVRVSGSTIEGNRVGVDSLHNSTIEVRETSRVAANTEVGALAGLGSNLNISDTVIENNGAQGILANGASIVEVRDVSIRNNQSDGIAVRDLSYGFAVGVYNPNVQIIDNGGWGINCAGPSAITEAQNGFPIALITFSGNTAGATNCP